MVVTDYINNMPIFTTKFVSKREIARDTSEFRFEKPGGFVFKAGNSFDWMLINPTEPDPEGNTRSFSSISAPFEDYIGLSTRMRDTAFKRDLKGMVVGAEIKVEGPFGSFHLHHDTEKRAVFLAGGIGITPFISMIKEATHDKTDHKIILVYSDKTPEDIVYIPELQQLEKENPQFKLIVTMTRLEKATEPWITEVGRVNKEMLLKYLETFDNSVYYMAGPPEMVTNLRQTLMESGIDEDDMRWEEFSGY